MSQKLTNEIVDKRLENRNIKRLDDYINHISSMQWECLNANCNHKWYASFNSVNSNHGCPKCYGTLKYSNEEVDIILKEMGLIRLSEYKSYNKKMLCKCVKDGYEWEVSLSNLKNKSKVNPCPQCSNMIRITNEIIDAKLKNRNIIRIGNYAGPKNKISFKCKIDGRIWESTLNNITNGQGCPSCSGKEKLTNEIIDKRLENRNIKRLDDYINSKTKINWKCLKTNCDNEWMSTYSNIYNGKGCPICVKKNETRIYKYILSKYNKDQIKTQYKLIINNKKFFVDFVIDNIFIEYNGQQHYKPVEHWGGLKAFEKQQKRDQELRDYCKENNIRLIEIPYWLSEEEQYRLISF